MGADVEQVRTVALSLPETTEKHAWGMVTFRVAGKIFTWVSADDTSMAIKCPHEEHAELIIAEPHKFFVPGDQEHEWNWIHVRLDAIDDPGELHAMLTDAWRLTAPKRLSAETPEPSAT